MFKCLVALAVLSFASAQPYPDVPRDHWAVTAIEELSDLGVLLGMPDGTFQGETPISRYEAAAMLARLLDVFKATLAQQAEQQQEELDNLNSVLQAALGEIALLRIDVDESRDLDAATKAEVGERLSAFEASLQAVVNRIESGELRGPQGEAGPQGPRGSRGERGERGPQGDRGEPGASRLEPEVDVDTEPAVDTELAPEPAPFINPEPEFALPQPAPVTEVFGARARQTYFGVGLATDVTAVANGVQRFPLRLSVGNDTLLGFAGLGVALDLGRRGPLFSDSVAVSVQGRFSVLERLFVGPNLGFQLGNWDKVGNNLFVGAFGSYEFPLSSALSLSADLEIDYYLGDIGTAARLYPQLGVSLRFRP